MAIASKAPDEIRREPLLLPMMPKELPTDDMVDQVYGMLTTRSLKRKSPPFPVAIKQVLGKELSKPEGERKLKFMIIWGGFKNRGEDGSLSTADENDYNVLKHMKDSLDTIQKATGVKVEAKILFSNVHAVINGRSIEESNAYLNGVDDRMGLMGMADGLGMEVVPLNQVYLKSDWRGKERIYERTMEVGKRRGLRDFDKFMEWSEKPEQHPGVQRLIDSARKHSQHIPQDLLDMDEPARKSASTYYSWRSFEADMLSKRFSDTTFITFSDTKIPEVNPKASLYWWTLKHGKTEVPWFTPERKEAKV
ncbi:hypothetical protein ACFLRF_03885 [Candidatus Altiarchaeota archaeon]